jgi:hypothetical protein
MSDFDPNEEIKDTNLYTYSVQEITNIFSEIDEKIQSLHSCSNEDFLTLNAYFKKYYADSKTISANAGNLFNIITNPENRISSFLQLENFQKSLRQLLNFYETNQSNLVQSFDETTLEMEKMFVTANNLKQDLMTLKLLVTNLKLEIFISADPTNRMARKASDFNELIIQTKSFFVEFFKNSNQFKDLIKTISTQISQQSARNVININDLLSNIFYSSNLLDQKYEEAKQNIPKLSENTKNTSDSIAKIITNLQYQDIIRQKIEHIQITHKEILRELRGIKDSDDEKTKMQQRLKWFVQIRDIAGLQAAQLIHANKEYQRAIEVISGRFLEVGNDMTRISDLCHQITGNAGKKFSHFDEIKENFEKSSQLGETIRKSIQFSKNKIDLLQNQLSEIITKYYELSDFIKTIDKSITRSIDKQDASEGEHFENTIKQIRNILVEMHTINNLYQSQFEKIKQICENIAETNVQPNENNRMLDHAIFEFLERYNELNNNLNVTNENIYKILDENQQLSYKISEDIKSSLEQIKYYDYFDRVIEEIIQKLNEINIRLQNIDESIAAGETHQTLETLKQRYTMQSEHVIHDNISVHKNIDLQHLDSTGVDEDDDNLELF